MSRFFQSVQLSQYHAAFCTYMIIALLLGPPVNAQIPPSKPHLNWSLPKTFERHETWLNEHGWKQIKRPLQAWLDDKKIDASLRRRVRYLADMTLALDLQGMNVLAIQTQLQALLNKHPDSSYDVPIDAINQLLTPLKEEAELRRKQNALAYRDKQIKSKLNQLLLGSSAKPTELTPWRPGMFWRSTGRYACITDQQTDLFATGSATAMRRPYFLFEGGHAAEFHFSPADSQLNPLPVSDSVTWVSSRLGYQGITMQDMPFDWQVTHGLMAPGPLLKTNAPAISIRFSVNGIKSPGLVVVPTSQGTRVARDMVELQKTLKIQSESWLLFLRNDQMALTPVLMAVTPGLNVRRWGQRELVLAWRSENEGSTVQKRIGFAFASGVKTLSTSNLELWKKPNAQRLARFNQLVEVFDAYPLQCMDFYRILPNKQQIQVQLKTLADRRDPSCKIWTAIPPMVQRAAALRIRGIGLPANAQNTGIMTKYGMYLLVPDDQARFTLPIPNLPGAMPLATTKAKAMFASLRQSGWVKKMANPKSWMQAKTGRALIHLVNDWLVASYLGTDIIDQLDGVYQADMQRLRNAVINTQLGKESRFLDRVDPRSGRDYLIFGWLRKYGDLEMSGDISNFSGYLLYGMYARMLATGHWDQLQTDWPLIKRLFLTINRRDDWAIMGPSCMEWGIEHNLDMGPDAFKGPVAMYRLAKQQGDDAAADLATYAMARQGLALSTALVAGEYNLQFSNTGDEQSLLQTGWDARGGVNPWHSWRSPRMGAYVLTGTVPFPQAYELYTDQVPHYLTRYWRETIQHHLPYPKWIDLGYQPATQKPIYSHNAHDISQYFTLACMVDGDSDQLQKFANKWFDGGRKILMPLSRGIYNALNVPLKIAHWEPSRLVHAKYDTQLGIAELHLTQASTSPQTEDAKLILVSAFKPISVRVNGKKVSCSKTILPNQWRVSLGKALNLSVQIRMPQATIQPTPWQIASAFDQQTARQKLQMLAKSAMPLQFIQPQGSQVPIRFDPKKKVTQSTIAGVPRIMSVCLAAHQTHHKGRKHYGRIQSIHL